jgi:hypothetical protein
MRAYLVTKIDRLIDWQVLIVDRLE